MSRENSPFKFLDSYQQADADVFFGREKETQDLYNALSGVKHLMVYGPSGSGKTSLVECGLRNQFSDADWYAITIRKGADINASVFASINNALKEKTEIDPVTRMPADPGMEFGPAIEKLFAERYQPVYLLFDQFEELLISGEETEKKKFFTLLNKLIRNKVPCRIMLIMREEFIGHLSEFELLCPSIFQHRFRVEKMGRKHVEEVIYHILEAPRYRAFFNVDDSHKLAESILSKLPDRKKEIELAHVQVFLGELWDRAPAPKIKSELPVLSTDLIHDDDNLETVLESFLKKQMTELEGSYGERVPLELLAAMISERFTKLQLSEAAIKTDLEQKKVVTKKPIVELLQELEKRRIIRTLKAGDETQYEISHDVLALVVGQNPTEEMKMREKAVGAYKVYQDRQGLFTQDDIDYLRPFEKILSYPEKLQKKIDNSIKDIKKKRDDELTKTRKRLITVYIILGVALVALAIAGYFGNKAERAKNESESLSLVSYAYEQLEENPAFAIRLAELAWQKSPTQPPALIGQRIVSKAFYKSLENKALFYKNNLVHEGPVSNAEFSPDGKMIVTASEDYTARIWDAETGKEIHILSGHEDEVSSAEFSPDGKKILTASQDYTARIWDAETGNALHTLRGHEADVISAVFSPDGKRIVTASYDNTSRIWNAETGKELHMLSGHEDWVNSAEFSFDGKRIVTASWDNTARIWDTETGKAIHTLVGHEDGVNSAEFSPDGKKIVTASTDKTARIWDAETGNTLHMLTGHAGRVNSAEFSPACPDDPLGGKMIVTASDDKTARIWQSENGKVRQTLLGHQSWVYYAEFSPDGKMIVTASGDKTARIWDAENGKELHTLPGHESWVYCAEFSPACPDDPLGGKMIVTASQDKTARIWDAENVKVLQTLPKQECSVYSAEFSPACPDDPLGGKMIVTASYDSTARIWDAETGKVLQTLLGHEDWINSAIFSPDGKKIVTPSFDNTAKIWDAETGKVLHTLTGHESDVYSAKFSPDGQMIVTGSEDKTAKIWDTETGKELHTLPGHEDRVINVEFSPKRKIVVTASADKTARIWDAETGKVLQTLPGHENWINSAIFSPDGNMIVFAFSDSTARIWDIESGREIDTLSGHEGDVYSAEFSPDGKMIVTASADKTAKIWNAESGREIHTLTGHEDEVNSAEFSPACPNDPIGGKMIVTASADKTAKIWDAESGREIHTLTGHEGDVYSAEFSPDGKRIVTASGDGTVMLWLTPEGIIDWLGKQDNIYKLSNKDMEDLGIDFIDLDK